MVVVLCDSFQDARQIFTSWVDLIRKSEDIEFRVADQYSLRAETSDGLQYIFVDYHFKNVLEAEDTVFVPSSVFLACYGLSDPDSLRQMWRDIINA